MSMQLTVEYCRASQESPTQKKSSDWQVWRRLGMQVAVNIHTLRRKGKRCAADSKVADWRGGGQHGGV